MLALFVNLPIIYTAKATEATSNDDQRLRGFFERCVITNVPSTDFRRLWILYVSQMPFDLRHFSTQTLVWIVLIICLVTSWSYYTAVRSDDFRPASLTSRKKRAHENARFMPNRHSVRCTFLVDVHCSFADMHQGN